MVNTLHMKLHLTCLIVFIASPVFGVERGVQRVRPEGLRSGDTIMMVAPSGPLDRQRMERARGRLEAMGFVVKVPDDLYRQRGYLAGTDEQRAAELMAAFTDSEVKAVFPGTGGYGMTRILDRLDYDVIAANPKIVIGFSDITGLHLALAAKTNLVSFHAPSPMWGLGSPGNLSEFSAKSFWHCLLADSQEDRQGFAYEILSGMTQPQSVRPGVARGRLIGGNLSLIVALMGTPYEIETRGAVLFMEDVGEAPYRIDRYLSQLRLGGKLDKPAAVILGHFTKCAADEGKPSLTLDQVFNDYFGDAPYPVIKDFPVGHHEWNATLPMGILAEVDGRVATVRILENPVVEPKASSRRQPIGTIRTLSLGTQFIDVVTHRFGNSRLLLCNLHDNENTSVTAAAEVLLAHDGRLVQLLHEGTRNLAFGIGERDYVCDPNRIFTPKGIRDTLEKLSQWDAGAQQAVNEFATDLLRVYGLDTVEAVVALHNNTEGSYSAIQYQDGQELATDAAKVHLEYGQETDDFFFVTEKRFFDALRAKRFNVVLQDNSAVTDDGSLSVYCGQRGIPYVNVESQHGHLKSQKAMIEALLDVLPEDSRIPSSR